MAEYCKDYEIAELRDAFRAMDYENTGYLTSHDLKRAFREAGLRFAEAEIDDLVNSIDHDNTGVINYTEFLAATLDMRTALNKERLWHAFKHFDPTGDGKITRDDLLQVFRRRGEPMDESEIDSMLQELDQLQAKKKERISGGGHSSQNVAKKESPKRARFESEGNMETYGGVA